MITAKQRAYLKGIAHNLKPLSQLGKEGMTPSFIESLNQLLEIHELVKVSVLETNQLNVKEAASELAKLTDADFVQAIGRKFTLYRAPRVKKDEPKIVLPRI